jgi:hypothetical protein
MGILWLVVSVWFAQATPAPPAAGPAAPPPAPGPVALALVRADRTLQPLARLEGEAWSEAAPGPAGPWRLWLFDDPVVKTDPFAPRAARPITSAPRASGAACATAAGLDADLAAGAAPDALLGLALSGTDARPDLPVLVPVDSDLGRSLAAKAAAAFHRAEDETLTLESEELPKGFPRFAARRERPITWTRIVRQGFAQGQSRTYYLEGRKDYAGFRGLTDIGAIRTTGHVFVRTTPERETVDAEVDLSDVEGHQSIFRTPLAIVALPARTVWVFAVQGVDERRLEVMELGAAAGRPRSVWQGPDGCGAGRR